MYVIKYHIGMQVACTCVTLCLQAMHTREDRVLTVYMPDGSTVVEHADGTRITTMYHNVEVQVESEDTQETGQG